MLDGKKRPGYRLADNYMRPRLDTMPPRHEDAATVDDAPVKELKGVAEGRTKIECEKGR